MRSTTLVLIRHAESVANRDGFLGGHRSCLGLTDAGRRQAAALRDRLAGDGFAADALLTSRLPRAIETARVITPAVAGGTLTAQTRCDLCDVHWGALDGAPVERLREWSAESDDAYRRVAPDGESWLMFERRARRALLRLAAEFAGRTVVVVTHSGIVKSSLQLFGGAPGSEAAGVDLSYTGITTWVADPGGRWHGATLDDHTHLTEPSTVDVG